MKLNNEMSLISRRIGRVAPSFIILAVIGVGIASLLRVASDLIPMAVLVPFTVVFLMTRILVLVVPTPSEQEIREMEQRAHEQADKSDIGPVNVATICLFLSGVAAVASLASGFIYAGLHLATLSNGAFGISKWLGIATLALFGFVCLCITYRLVAKWSDVIVAAIWSVLSWPTRVADCMPYHRRLTTK